MKSFEEWYQTYSDESQYEDGMRDAFKAGIDTCAAEYQTREAAAQFCFGEWWTNYGYVNAFHDPIDAAQDAWHSRDAEIVALQSKIVKLQTREAAAVAAALGEAAQIANNELSKGHYQHLYPHMPKIDTLILALIPPTDALKRHDAALLDEFRKLAAAWQETGSKPEEICGDWNECANHLLAIVDRKEST